MYPENDAEFQDKTITAVEGDAPGRYAITCDDGWSMGCGDECSVKPEVGQSARFYGRGIGGRVRGLFINGARLWYRTEAEDAEHSEIQIYGADAADWLKRWDEGRNVFSIEMGGMGPGYEQAIQVTAAECLRWLLENKPDASLWKDKDAWRQVSGDLDKALWTNPTINGLGLSGAQAGAAKNLAARIYMDGPRKVMNEPSIKDRHIQVQRTFPGMAA